MVQRIYCRCSMCEKTTMIKYQVGFADFPIIYTCPNCMTEVRGMGRNDETLVTVNFDFENARIVNKTDSPDYYLSISREFPIAHIKEFESTDEFALSPFMRLTNEISQLTDQSLWKRAGRFAENSTEKINHAMDLIGLWEHQKTDILVTQLRKDLPLEYFPMFGPNGNRQLGVS